MERVKAFLLQRVGPLPVVAWAGIILAGILGYMWFTKTGLFAASSPVSNDVSGASDGSGLLDPNAGGGGGGLGLASGLPSDLSGSSVAAGGSLSPTAYAAAPAPAYATYSAPAPLPDMAPLAAAPAATYTPSPYSPGSIFSHGIAPIIASLPTAAVQTSYSPARSVASGWDTLAGKGHSL